MANKIVVNNVDVSLETSDGVVIVQSPLTAGSYDLAALTMRNAYTNMGGKKANGHQSVALYDSSNTKVKEWLANGKIGTLNEDNGMVFSIQTIQVKGNASETVLLESDSGGNSIYSYGVTPASFATGKLVMEFSGGMFDLSQLEAQLIPTGLSPLAIGYLAAAKMDNKVSGHIKIEVDFSVVSY